MPKKPTKQRKPKAKPIVEQTTVNVLNGEPILISFPKEDIYQKDDINYIKTTHENRQKDSVPKCYLHCLGMKNYNGLTFLEKFTIKINFIWQNLLKKLK